MEKVIWKFDDKRFKQEIYIIISDDFKETKTDWSKPYLEYVFGIRQTEPAWIPQTLNYVAEDGFVMIGDELLSALEKQITNYKETKITLYDHEQDTDAEIIFDCKKDKIVLSGSLGNTTSESSGFIKTSFKFEVGKEILNNLYNVLRENALK